MVVEFLAANQIVIDALFDAQRNNDLTVIRYY